MSESGDEIIQEHFAIYPTFSARALIRTPWITIGLDQKIAPNLERKLLAAIASHHLGVSLQTAYKSYTKEKADLGEASPKPIGDELIDLIELWSRYPSDRFQDFGTRPMPDEILTEGIWAADVNLSRFPALLESAKLVANRGFLFETTVLIRQGIEQLAWVWSISKFDDTKSILKTSPTKSIGALKEIYPTVGKYYGILSNYAHWHPGIHNQFIDRTGEFIATVLASKRYRAAAIFNLAILVEIFAVVFEAIHIDKIEKPHFWNPFDNRISTSRPIKSFLADVADKFHDQVLFEDLIAFVP